MQETFIEFTEIAKKLFKEEKFAEMGIDNNKGKEHHYQRLGNQLFYLQQQIVEILAPYIIKFERLLKKIANNATSIKKAINLINQNSRYLEQTNWKYKRTPNYLSNQQSDSKPFILLIEAARICRNRIMHANNFILGRHFELSRDLKLTIYTMQNNIEEKYKKMFNSRVISKFTLNNHVNEPTQLAHVNEPTQLALLLLTLTFFNSEKVYDKVFANVDYALYVFQRKTNICSIEEFWNWIGLKVKWIKKI